MLLPELIIPVSIEIFETNFEYLLRNYIESINKSLSFSKSDIGNNGHRYSIFVENIDLKNSPRTIIGEIDVKMIDEKKVDIKSAIYNLEETKVGIRILNDIYQMIYRNWKIAPRSLEGSYAGFNVATETFIKIGRETGYHRLPGILSIMPESEIDYWTDGKENKDISNSDEFQLSVSKTKREGIIQRYQLEINKGLPENYRLVEQSNKTADQSIIGTSIENKEEFTQQQTIPWEQVTESETLQKMVRLIHEGLSPKEIADKLHYEKSTIYKRSSELRKKYGKETVPYFQERRNIED